MRIGIVTFYRVANYGAMLQAYALWRYLQGLGHEVCFVRYPFCAPARLSLARCLISQHLRGVRIKLKNHVRHTITRFAASYPQTERCSSLADLKRVGDECDAFIVGSDQMWNPIWCSKELLSVVMLDFVADGKKRISYAASFGGKEWRQDQNAEVAAALLKKFDAISVREESGLEVVRALSGRADAQCLLDPTLLWTADFYRKLMLSSAVVEEEPYIFSYLLDEWADDDAAKGVLKIVMDAVGIETVKTDRETVAGWLAPLCRPLGVTGKISVPEWLSRIANASYVVTNSFHGTVFAILFHRPFVTLPVQGRMSGMNERMYTLLKMAGLESRCVSSVEALNKIIAQKID